MKTKLAVRKVAQKDAKSAVRQVTKKPAAKKAAAKSSVRKVAPTLVKPGKTQAAPSSKFLISVEELRKRIRSSELSKKLREAILASIKFENADATALWLEPGFEFRAQDFAASPHSTCAIVFNAPVKSDKALLMNGFFDVFAERDKSLVLFLEPVSAPDFCTVPVTFTVFAKGLHVKGIACFDADDASTSISGSLVAQHVISGLERGLGWLESGASVKAKAIAGKLMGAAKGAIPVVHKSLETMLPILEEQGEDDAWAKVMSFLKTTSKRK